MRPPSRLTASSAVGVIFLTAALSASSELASVDAAFVSVAGGCFTMGSPPLELPRDPDERAHEVCVEDFELMAYEVTVAQFADFVAASGYVTDAERDGPNRRGCWTRVSADPVEWGFDTGANWRSPLPPREAAPDDPVSCISWNDAQAYIEWRNADSGARPPVRLPTEAEWEFAARGATETPYHWGLTPENSCSHANLADLAHGAAGNIECDDGYAEVAPVGMFAANAWGLYDMTGNVWEWTCSVYDAEYSGLEMGCARQGDGGSRSSRGGSFDDAAKGGRIANRSAIPPSFSISLQGFRLAR